MSKPDYIRPMVDTRKDGFFPAVSLNKPILAQTRNGSLDSKKAYGSNQNIKTME
jgi:hypothetical protein